MNIFRYKDYRKIIELLLSQSKEKNTKVSYSWLAQKIGMQKPYVSKVMNGHADFNQDQIFLVGEVFQLNQEEIHFLSLLVEYQRSGVAKRKKQIMTEIRGLQEKNVNSRNYISADFIEHSGNQNYMNYYLNPYVQVIHMMMSLPKIKLNEELIAEKLGVSKRRVETSIGTLKDLGLIQWDSKNKTYKSTTQKIHLDKKSPLSQPNHVLHRVSSIEQISKLSSDQRHLYSVTFTISPETSEQINGEFLEFLKRCENLVAKTKPSEIWQMNFDLFPWMV